MYRGLTKWQRDDDMVLESLRLPNGPRIHDVCGEIWLPLVSHDDVTKIGSAALSNAGAWDLADQICTSYPYSIKLTQSKRKDVKSPRRGMTDGALPLVIRGAARDIGQSVLRAVPLTGEGLKSLTVLIFSVHRVDWAHMFHYKNCRSPLGRVIFEHTHTHTLAYPFIGPHPHLHLHLSSHPAIHFTIENLTMVSSALSLGLMAALTSATPLASRQVVPNYPPTSTSQGFYLVVNVTDPSTDFDPPINNQYVNSIHVGAALNLVGVTPSPGRIFYQNGTVEEVRYGQSTVITDGATPPSPFGLTLNPDEGSDVVSTARLDVGFGTVGVVLSRFPDPYTYLLPQTFLACNEEVDYYHQEMIIIKRSDFTVNDDGTIDYNVPDNCAAVRLLPECTELNELPDDAYSSHEFAANSQCYEDVSELVWSEYGP